ncbi:hypothetical protein SPRG_07910 [Saprolegnia parasitica CBS 223.65]|uniref:Fibronectin type-III domain-containing protein n=1 Tax=Saprolegnia parasitica (strain CBS 223.65) TaxID=695850 RepID=A0A067CI58_SAPPC|nr:hypothetical protein SPRG_07910 [Saprolegnia parasitica CBS 223.65]KDO26507.1 hypothetical protein SPRG_07910 [Saprolegnia parasitica CBS 223.65]|eukprot:XP_012202652.1 hypothetical protein SPRG_07910 [Saprolegnia parasitica CBS 223.65]
MAEATETERRPSLVHRAHRISIDEHTPPPSPVAHATPYDALKVAPHRWRQHVPIAVYLVVVVSVLTTLFYYSFFAAKVNGQAPAMMGCRYFGYWKGPNCGLHGIDCQPFQTDWFAFRCPSGCLSDQSSVLAVIGSGPYRGDSRICKAAIHAGAIRSGGGCGLMRYDGERMSFAASTQHGVTTQAFPSWFPKTMSFYLDAASISHCVDLSWYIFSVGAAATLGLAWFPALSPLLLTHVQCIWGFIYVTLIASPTSFDYDTLSLHLFTDICIVVVAVHCLYLWVAQYTFAKYASYSRKERFVYWGLLSVVPFHLMLHLTQFAFLPWLNINFGGYRATPSVNVWTYIVFGLVGLVALGLAFHLLRHLYQQKALLSLLALYVLVAIYMAIVHGLYPHTLLHLHHVQIGLLLLPATAFPTRSAFFVQAIGLGLFIQGYAAWGWPTFLDTPPASYYLDAPMTPPDVRNISSSTANISWPALVDVQGYALMLNDVQVYRGVRNWTLVSDLRPNTTYFARVSGIGNGGADGSMGPIANFTTAI